MTRRRRGTPPDLPSPRVGALLSAGVRCWRAGRAQVAVLAVAALPPSPAAAAAALAAAAGGVSALLLTRLDDLTALFRTAAR